MCSSAAKKSFTISKYEFVDTLDVSQGEEEMGSEVEEMGSEKLGRVVREQRN